MEDLLIRFAGIVVLAVGAQWLAWRLHLPSILLLLLVGFIAGPITGFLAPEVVPSEVLFPIVSLSVAIILFEGGLSLRFSELPENANVIFRLISIGALVTWAIAGVAAHSILGIGWPIAILTGAILIVTGPTVVGPLLRQVRPKGRVGTILKWEGILIDPIGAIVAVIVFEAILQGELAEAPEIVLLGVMQSLVVGVLLGLVASGLLILILRQYWVPDNLQNPVTLLFLLGFFAASNFVSPESGLLMATIMGLVMANQRSVSISHIIEFKENLQILLIGLLFILLASRVSLDSLSQIGWQGLIYLAVLIIVARPLSVWLSTWRSGLTIQEKTFISWMAPRGIVAAAVASIFAFELLELNQPDAELLVPVTFLVIVGTVLFYSLTASPVARWLGISEQNPQGVLIVGAHELSRKVAAALQEQGFRAILVDTNAHNIFESQLAGLEAHYGDAISDEVLEDLEFSGIGRLLALTPNDEVNSLASLHFPQIFSRAEVYQLPMMTNGVENASKPSSLRGRFLFGPQFTYDYLADQIDAGATIRATPITEEFTYADYQSHYKNMAVPLFLITERERLMIYSGDYQPLPRAGQTLISLIPAGAENNGSS